MNPPKRSKYTPKKEEIYHTTAERMPIALYNKIQRIANKHYGGNVSEYFRAFARADQRQGAEEVAK